MKLSEIKKLKVAELRVRLKEFGLDSRGLKAELVDRLWSALEGGPETQTAQSGQSGQHDGEEDRLQHDSASSPPAPAEPLTSPPKADAVCKPGDSVPAKPGECTDSVPAQPGECTDSVPAQPGECTVSVPAKPGECTECVPAKPGECTDFVPAKPGECTDSVPAKPEECSDSVSAKPGECTESVPAKPGECTECVPAKPGECTDFVPAKPGECTDSVPAKPEECSDSVSAKPGECTESVPAKPGATGEHADCATQTVCQAEVAGELGSGRGDGEEAGENRRPLEALPLPISGRGRAFYEFKEEIRYKRAKSPQPPLEMEDAEEENDEKVRLDPYGSDLHFEVGPDGATGRPRFWSRFPLMWSGCRLTHGVLQGKVGFEVRLERKLLPSQLEEQEEGGRVDQLYGLRVGWSVDDSSLLLGEDELSYAYDGRGKKVVAGKEEEFGELFSEGDIIGCYASFSTDGAAELSFQRNGRFMGVAFSLDASVLRGRALFPHALCKSCSVRFHLDPTAPPWYPSPVGFTPLAALPAGERLRGQPAPSSKAQCEVVLMVGLPGSGKSHWARTYMGQHPEKRFQLLGTEELLACMINGGQRESRLRQASQCLTDLIKLAAHTPANYILDQANILFSARRHKLQLFRGFRRRVVVVFPSAEDWKRRLVQHQTQNGEQIPETALLKLQVSCSLPEQQSEPMEELQYVELPQAQAQLLLQEYREEARRLLPPIPKQEKKKPWLHKRRPHPYILPPPRKNQWNRPNEWNETGVSLQSWGQQPRYWNAAYQDMGYYYAGRDFGYAGYQGYC